MYISLHASGKDKKNVYVRVMESKRDSSGKVVKIVRENLGRLSDLQAKDPDALEKLRAKYDSKRKADRKVVVDQRLKIMEETLATAEQETALLGSYPTLGYGHYPLRKIWRDELHLDRKINYLKKTSGKKFDVDAALQYLVAHKLLKPCSVLSAFADKDNFLGDPARDLTLDQFYETYDFVSAHHDELFGWVNRRLDAAYGKDRATLVFYDVTNAYFETAMTDAERETVRSDFSEIVQNKADQWFEEGLLTQEEFDEDGNVLADKLPSAFWDEISDEKLKYLRMRGPSKEHRFDLPLVSIALVIDRHGFPMDVAVYSGNSSEFKTMSASIEALKKKYNIGSSIVVADRGLNSLGNLTMLQEANLGFLMAQKVSQLGTTLTEQMMDRSKYTPFVKDDPQAGGYLVIRNWTKTGSTGTPMKCTLVFTYDEKRKRRDEAILQAMVDIVKAKQAAGATIGPRKTGWAAFAKTEGDVEQKILGVDEEELNKKKALCGFAAMVYKGPVQEDEGNKVKDPELTGEQIAGTYRMLNRIETCFRTMKSNLGLRPMFVRLAEHIRGHVDICVLALLLMRIIQKKLEDQGVALSPQRISEVLHDMRVLAMKGRNDELSFLSVAPTYNFRRNREKLKTEEILKLIQEGKLEGNDRAAVLNACGLKPIPRASSRSELATALATRFPDNKAALPTLIEAVM